MEHQFLSEDEVAAYLNLDLEDIQGRVKCREIPYQTRGRRVVFDKGEIDEWASQRILKLPDKRLEVYHEKSSHGTSVFLHQPAIMPQMIQPDFVAPAMTAKTKASILRDLVELADRTGRLNYPKALLESLEGREDLCSTGMPHGFAIPHPRTHDSYLFEASFIVVGRSLQAINFGAPDGEPSNIFFLVCCQDDRMHLHTLARLCFMAAKSQLLSKIEAALDADAIYQSILASELEVVNMNSQ
jgi:mannitol/fructose-specific phosphotransferase system IIA component (Ntr-type)/predicted DNA-binding transcriptional regulator AlpA